MLAHRLHGRLLDVGCGSQPYRVLFEQVSSEIVACDYSPEVKGIDFHCPADSIPQASESFHSVVSTEVLEHVPFPDKALAEFWRILRPGGHVLLSVPCYWPPHELPYDFFRYPLHGIVALAERAGFRVVEVVPRGGKWALWGQVGAHVLQGKLPRCLKYGWNRMFLMLDRINPAPWIALGWTLLLEKNPSKTSG
jgi:ubiquinone/menaquinone biosynthesis C-methylase UbiE